MGHDLVYCFRIRLYRDDQDILSFRNIGYGLEEDLFPYRGREDDPVFSDTQF